MLRNGCFLVAIGVSLTACGGGGSGDSSSSTPLLVNAASEGTAVLTPEGVSLEGSLPSFSLAADDTLTVSFDDGSQLDFAAADAAFTADSGVVFFANNNNRDGALVAMPTDSPLDYTAFGLWILGSSANLTTVNGAFSVADAGAGHFGIATAPADLPTTGSANYLGSAVGAVANGSQIQDLLNGTFQARADFAAGDLDITVSLIGSAGGDFATLTADGAEIDGGASSFATSATGASLDSGHTGVLSGQFYGPGAAEVGGQFDLDDGSTRVFGGFGGN